MFGLLMTLVVCVVLQGPLTHARLDINVATVQNIRLNRNQSALPCDNFWAYACGNWSSNYVDNFEIAEKQYAEDMAKVFSDNQPVKLANAAHLWQQMSNYYAACVAHDQEQLQVPEHLFLGQFKWTRVSAKLRKYGLNGVFFDETVDVAYNDSTRYVVQLKMPSFSSINNWLPVHNLAQLEDQLKSLNDKYSNEEPPLYSWNFAKLKEEIPQIDWQNYFEELLGKQFNLDALRLEVSDVEYLRDLGVLLQNSNQTKLELYLRVQLANLVGQARPGQGAATGRAYGCIHHMRALLPVGMNYIYDRCVYRSREQDQQQLMEIFTNLRRMFHKYLDSNRLQLSNEQLAYLRAKLRSMKLKLGNLPEQPTAQFYDNHYANATFGRTDFQHNFWEALRLRTQLQHAPLLLPRAVLVLADYYVNDDLFSARNAPYFEHERNTLIVPMIFMQWPLYDYRQHDIFRSSLMGFILAHELNHAFEQEGILFDADGNESAVGLGIRQMAKFQAALRCVQQKTPTVSLKERLADVNGLQLAYDAFFGLGHDSQRFEYRPYAFEGELLAPELFHLNFAQFFCGRLPMAIGHDMDNVRVQEAVMNLHQFFIDFKCNSKLLGCEMWRPIDNQDNR